MPEGSLMPVTGPHDSPVVVQMTGISKRFGNVVANASVNFDLAAGEVHALLGENGAGKTTLMNVLYGLYHPDAGEILLRGQPVLFHSPADAIASGIGMVHQTFRLIPNLTVAENVLLGLPSDKPILDIAAASARIAELAKRYKLDVDPLVPVWQLSAGQQQQVEIVKALYRQVRILILDEPTSVLTPFETEGLFACMEQMAAEGYSVVFISHKLGEVLCASHRISVMRDGRLLATVDRESVTQNDLARMTVGRDVAFRLDRRPMPPGEVLLQVDGLEADDEKGLRALHDLSLTVRRGEVLGIAGVTGNGQGELAETLNGMRRAAAGEVLLSGKPVTNLDAGKITRLGVGFIPSKSRQVAVLSDFSIEDNTALKVHGLPPYRRGLFLSRGAIGPRADNLLNTYDVRPPDRTLPAGKLSGGNLQKMVVGSELARDPQLIIAVDPTAGLDVGATEDIRKRLLEERERGKAILLISSDLEEIMTLSDRIAVMYRGRVTGVVTPECATPETMGLLMAGLAVPEGRGVWPSASVAGDAPPGSSGPRFAPQAEVSSAPATQRSPLFDLPRLMRYFTAPSGWTSVAATLGAIILALIVVGGMIALMGVNPLKAYEALWRSAFGTRNGLGETLVRATPLLLAGLGIVVAFRGGMWNIGAEGQLYMGALGATLAGIFLPPLPSLVHICLVILAGFVFGALYGALPGVMRAYRGANEIVTTIMLNYLAIYAISFLVNGPLRDTNQLLPQPQSFAIAAAARLPKILTGTRAHAGIFVALAAVILVYILMWKSVPGFRIRIVGQNPAAARFGGINVKHYIVLAMAISGGLAGLAGMVEVSGVRGYLIPNLSANYGYTAIAVALLGGLHPAGVTLSAIFFASLMVGADGLQRSVGVPTATVLIIEGLVLIFVMGSRVWAERRRGRAS